VAIFDKPISSLSEQDLLELIDGNAVENIRLEFKREYPSKDEMLKKLSSFANTFGGFVVVGAEANGRDGRIVALPGVEPTSNYKQTIVQWCFGGVSPPLNVEVSNPIPVGTDSKVCYVLSLRESETAPHFLNGRKGVYVRTDEFSSKFDAQLATEAELRQLLDRRKLVRDRRQRLLDRARERFESFATSRFAELRTDDKKTIGANFDIAIVPRFPVAPLLDHFSLLEQIKTLTVPWRGVGFPRRRQAFVSQHESAIWFRPGSKFSLLEANIWGLLVFSSEIEERRAEHENAQGMDLRSFLGNVFAYLRYASRLFDQLRYTGPLRFEVRMRRMKGVIWYGLGRPGSELDDAILIVSEIDSERLSANADDVALEILTAVFSATNWPDLVSPQELGTLRSLAYEFNQW